MSASSKPRPDATAFVRQLFAQHGDEITDLDVRRASLEDTYLAMVQQHEDERRGARPQRSTEGRPMNPRAHAVRIGLRRGWTEFQPERPQPAGPGLLPVHRGRGRSATCSSAATPRSRGPTCSYPSVAMPSILGGLMAFGLVIGPAYALAMEREDGTLLRAKAVPNGVIGYVTGRFSSRA